MRHRHSFRVLLAVAVLACGGESDAIAPPPPPPPPAPPVQLKDVVVSSLPSPYYHFEYDTSGRISVVSFASGLTRYVVSYDGGRISALANTAGNRDRVEYSYDAAGRVDSVAYVDRSGQIFATVAFTYDGQRLTGVERRRRFSGGFLTEKTMSFAYHADGNVSQVVVHRPAIAGWQDETTTTDRYDDYDHAINVDGFGLIHDDFFDHLVLLPGVRLQTGNPRRETRTGDGINYRVDYTYTYDAANRPRMKSGVLVLTNGSDAGRTIQTLSEFSYY